MANSTHTRISDLIDRTAVDPIGQTIGTVSAVYVDEVTGEPAWLAITTGWFGTRVSFAPVADAYVDGEDVVVAYAKDTVKDAPNIDADAWLSPDVAFTLYAYYGIPTRLTSDRGTDIDSIPGRRGRVSDTAMTRSEEEHDMSKHERESGRVRLRRWVETEDVHMTVPIRREKLRLVPVPITDADRDAALSGRADISEAQREVVVREEGVDVDKRILPKERFRLETVVETDDVDVSGTHW